MTNVNIVLGVGFGVLVAAAGCDSSSTTGQGTGAAGGMDSAGGSGASPAGGGAGGGLASGGVGGAGAGVGGSESQAGAGGGDIPDSGVADQTLEELDTGEAEALCAWGIAQSGEPAGGEVSCGSDMSVSVSASAAGCGADLATSGCDMTVDELEACVAAIGTALCEATDLQQIPECKALEDCSMHVPWLVVASG